MKTKNILLLLSISILGIFDSIAQNTIDNYNMSLEPQDTLIMDTDSAEQHTPVFTSNTRQPETQTRNINFVYLRYDRPSYNVSSIVSKVKQLTANPNTVFFYENKTYTGIEINKLLNDRFFLEHTSVYEPIEELEILNGFLEKHLDERIVMQGSHCIIEGNNDNGTMMTFIFHKEDDIENLLKFISINNLNKRRIKMIFYLFDEEKLTITTLEDLINTLDSATKDNLIGFGVSDKTYNN